MEWLEFFLALLAGILLAAVILKVIAKIKIWRGLQYQPEKAANFTCEDGHVVRSKGEMIIDNWLTRQGITHDYEHTIAVHGHVIKYDWFLPETKTYVEYWGFWGKNYMRRKQEKLRLYKEGNLNLVSIEDKDLENIYERFPAKFALLTRCQSTQGRKVKFCPHCGNALDERFG